MYKNLLKEMQYRRLSEKEAADLLNISGKEFRRKVRSDSLTTLEALKLADALNIRDINYLFRS